MSEPVVYVLVCARMRGVLFLPDNLTGRCDVCGHVVQYRPHAPTPHILRCVLCAVDLLEPGDKVTTTAKMSEEIAALYKKRQS